MSSPAEAVRRWSDELARDPSSLVFIPLGEALRRSGQLDVALKVALRGLERHPYDADAHDLLARICVDRGDLEQAHDEWGVVLRLAPGHAGARKGIGFVLFRQGRLADAERALREAAQQDPGDASIAAALATIGARHSELAPRQVQAGAGARGAQPGGASRAAAPRAQGGAPGPDARMLFADVLADGHHAALLLDGAGLVIAGRYPLEDGSDAAQEVGAELSGVGDEAQRAMRHLGMGAWATIAVETEVATVMMTPLALGAPAPGAAAADGGAERGLLLVAADRALPLGLARRVLAGCAARARAWLDAPNDGPAA